MLNDPYPKQMLLGAKEIRMLLAMSESTWREFLRDPPADFPAPVQVGQTGGDHPRMRWRKSDVYYWIDSRPKCADWRGSAKSPERAQKGTKSRGTLPEPPPDG